MPSRRKVLITGVSGFLGWNLAVFCRSHVQLWGNYRNHAIRIKGCQTFPLDLTNTPQVKKILADLKPEAIIHTAAISHPDTCEENPEKAYRMNVEGTENLLSRLNPSTRFIYISTDLVFDGRKGWYKEEDPANPLNVYAHTKWEAEKRVQDWGGSYAIVRTSLMYGLSNGINNSFLQWMSRNLEAQHPVSLFTDQYRTCLFVRDAAQILYLLCGRRETGIFHLGGPERTNRYDFGKKLASMFGYPLDLIKPVVMQDVPARAIRAADCSLDSGKIIQLTGFRPCGVESGLRKITSGRNHSLDETHDRP
ncbi:MAG: SDR family oxidoreductase [bacterium]